MKKYVQPQVCMLSLCTDDVIATSYTLEEKGSLINSIGWGDGNVSALS